MDYLNFLQAVYPPQSPLCTSGLIIKLSRGRGEINLRYIQSSSADSKCLSFHSFQATDADVGINKDIRYLVPEGNGFFSIDENGQIRTIKPLDFEASRVHYLLVTARDTGINSRSTVANVTIQVEDVEDVLPVFPKREYTAQVPENERDYLITTVEVSYIISRYPGCVYPCELHCILWGNK